MIICDSAFHGRLGEVGCSSLSRSDMEDTPGTMCCATIACGTEMLQGCILRGLLSRTNQCWGIRGDVNVGHFPLVCM
jgi:hypothetical protein